MVKKRNVRKVLNMTSTLLRTFKTQSQYANLIEKIKKQPLWVKQSILHELKADLSGYSFENILENYMDTPIQLYKPKLSVLINKFYTSQHNHDFYDDMKLFIEGVQKDYTLLEIAQTHKWSLCFILKLLIESIDLGYVEDFENIKLKKTAYFLIDKINIGDYLVSLEVLAKSDYNLCLDIKHRAMLANETIELKDIIMKNTPVSHKIIDNLTLLKISARKNAYVLDDSHIKDEVISILRREIDSLLSQKSNNHELVQFYKGEYAKNKQIIQDSKEKLEQCTVGFVKKFSYSLF